ncbi:hypothetical protein A0H81_08419, partial [Grifola frondosa]
SISAFGTRRATGDASSSRLRPPCLTLIFALHSKPVAHSDAKGQTSLMPIRQRERLYCRMETTGFSISSGRTEPLMRWKRIFFISIGRDVCEGGTVRVGQAYVLKFFVQPETFRMFPFDLLVSIVMLKIYSSGCRYFTSSLSWNILLTTYQDANPSRDEEFVGNVNRLLIDPSIIPIWYAEGYNPSQNAGPSTSATTVIPSPSTAHNFSLLSHPWALRFQVSQLIHALFPYLPPDLPTPPHKRHSIALSLRAAVRNFDQALRTGLLGGLVRGLGLPEEAGTGIEAFLRAIQEQAREEAESGDHMDTD